jgi:hypothetical protein
MKDPVGRIQRPVKRAGADLHVLITLLSFALSVAGTRLLLELTGYPQLGGGELHFAHVLWGGLALFVAALLPLVLANYWVHRIGAALAGIGVGLFIDEVGKFITATNDYFHPAAAPIIYAFFLLTVLVYVRVRRPAMRSARGELYRAMHGLTELLDHDLEPEERRMLLARLEYVAGQSAHPDLSRLGGLLRDFLSDDSISLAPDRSTLLERWTERLRTGEERFLNEPRTRAALIGSLLALGIWSVYGALILMSPGLARPRLSELILVGRLSSAAQLGWFSAQLALQTAVGGSLIVSAGSLMLGEKRLGVATGTVALLLALTVVNLFVFYFDQFSTIMKATVELVAFLALRRYAVRFLL